MKKFFSLIIGVFLVLCCFGFTQNQGTNIIDNTKYSHAVLNDGTTVTETCAVNFSKFASSEVIRTMVTSQLKSELSNIITEISQKIANEKNTEVKLSINNKVLGKVEVNGDIVCLKITYSTLDAWKYFSNGGYSNITEKRLFTYDLYDQIGMIGGLTNLSGEQMLIGEYVKNRVYLTLDNISPSWRGDNTYLSSYSYITTLKRRHSNADSISIFNNYYYHQWLTDEDPEVKLWTTRPILVSWYVTAVIISLIVILIIYLLGRRKEKLKKLKEQQNLNTNNNENDKPVLFVKIDKEE